MDFQEWWITPSRTLFCGGFSPSALIGEGDRVIAQEAFEAGVACERKRCAACAENWLSLPEEPYDPSAQFVARQIAKKIRGEPYDVALPPGITADGKSYNDVSYQSKDAAVDKTDEGV
jgi:hypothetical protein